MAIHVNIGEAKTRLSELIAAAIDGEDVVVDKAGAPQVRLVTVAQPIEAEIERRAAKRRAAKRRSAIGMYRHLVGDAMIDVVTIKADDRWDEHYRRKFDDPD